jgi:hypothetical protein
MKMNPIIRAGGKDHIPSCRWTQSDASTDEMNQSVTSAQARRRTTMKTMFLTLAAILGVALGTVSLTQSAYASNVQLYPPSQATDGRG